ncbi:hypothetical protein LOD99_16059 [Oopsacas minuta]|uniref:Uncharacterized protein n=1 Tax=Oopsacas minuta TaxID=111878 RepID=A0AAV7K912_9METZ|nr:hypothetical protein LOD99_16059 [Oopsacas minuta]
MLALHYNIYQEQAAEFEMIAELRICYIDVIPLLFWIWKSLIPKLREKIPALVDRFFPKMSIAERAEFDPNSISCPLAGLFPSRAFDDEDLVEPDEDRGEVNSPEGVKVKED